VMCALGLKSGLRCSKALAVTGLLHPPRFAMPEAAPLPCSCAKCVVGGRRACIRCLGAGAGCKRTMAQEAGVHMGRPGCVTALHSSVIAGATPNECVGTHSAPTSNQSVSA